MTGLVVFAFGIGLVSPVNPCGFALLPALLATAARPDHHGSIPGRLAGGLRAGLLLTAGFAGTLTLAGLALTAGLRALTGLAPWLALAVGGLLLLAGLAMLTGRRLPLRLPTRIQPGTGGTRGAWGLFAFGVGYGIASLSCTLALLLAVVGQALATTNPLGMLAVFTAYAAGSATLLLLLAVPAAFASGLATRWIRPLLPHMTRITGALLVASGAYLLAYWAPVTTGGAPAGVLNLDPLASRVTTWVSTHQNSVVILALILVAATITAVLITGRSRSHRPTRPASKREEDPTRRQTTISLDADRSDSGGH